MFNARHRNSTGPGRGGEAAPQTETVRAPSFKIAGGGERSFWRQRTVLNQTLSLKIGTFEGWIKTVYLKQLLLRNLIAVHSLPKMHRI